MIRQFEQEEVSELLRQAMQPKGAKVIAAELGPGGIPYSTLMSEINSAVDSHKLGFFRVLEILDVTGVVTPLLTWVCRRYGHLPVRVQQDVPSGNELKVSFLCASEHLGEVAKALREFTSERSENGVDLSPAELEALLRKSERLLGDVHGFIAGVRAHQKKGGE
jgi:hypothetical protein